MDIEMIDHGFYFKTPMSCPLPVCINNFFAKALTEISRVHWIELILKVSNFILESFWLNIAVNEISGKANPLFSIFIPDKLPVFSTHQIP